MGSSLEQWVQGATVVGVITAYLSLITFVNFSVSDLFPSDGSLDCKYWTERGIWRNCVEFD